MKCIKQVSNWWLNMVGACEHKNKFEVEVMLNTTILFLFNETLKITDVSILYISCMYVVNVLYILGYSPFIVRIYYQKHFNGQATPPPSSPLSRSQWPV